MQAGLDDVRPDDGDLEDLAGDRLGGVAGEASAAATASFRPHVDDLGWLEPDAIVPAMPRLTAATAP